MFECTLIFLDFEDEIQAEDLITELAVSMTAEYRRSPFHLLESRYLTPIWDPNSIRGILDNLNPRNCHVILLSSLFPEVGSESESGTDVTDDSDYETDDSYDSSSDESSESFLSPEEESNLISTLPEEHRGISTPPTVTSSTSEPDAVFHSIHFNMPYWKDTINEELIVYWEDKSVAVPGSETLLQLPPPNKYIPRDLQVRKLSKQGPEAVFSSPNVRVWHASDPRFQIPKGIVTFSLLSNYLLQITSHESEVSPSPMIAVFHDLIPRILNEYLLKELYLAEMAYLESEILPRMNGIVITVNGFHDKILSLSSMIFRSLFDDQLFSDFRSIEIQVENLKKEYQNDSLLSGDAANTKRLEMLLPHQVPKPIRLSSLNQLYRSRTSFINSLKKYLQGYLESCCCEIFVYGNISVQDSVSFGKAVNKKLSGSKKGSKGKILHRNSFQQPSPVFVSSIDALTSIKVTPKSESERNVCLQVYFQVGSINPRDHSLLELLQRMMEEPLFNELRTQKQVYFSTCSILT